MKISLKLLAFTTIALLAACASTPQNPFVGSWAVNMDSPIGARPGTMNFAADGTGTMSIEAPGAEGQPPATFANATFEENTVKFSTSIDAQGQQITLDFTGAVDGDNITGEFNTDFGAMPVTGTRKQ